MSAPIKSSTLATDIATNIPIIAAEIAGGGSDLDPRLIFLERAAARLMMVEAGEIDLDEAIYGLVPSFERLHGIDEFGDLVERLAEENRAGAETRNRIPPNWNEMSPHALWQDLNSARPAPQSTIEAILYCVRERGLRALDEPANIERLRHCDPAAMAQINQRIAKLKGIANHG